MCDALEDENFYKAQHARLKSDHIGDGKSGAAMNLFITSKI